MTTRERYNFKSDNVDPLAVEVRNILLQYWDPCGVVGEEGLTNEYDAYIIEVMTWIKDGTPAKEIGSKLRRLQIEMFDWTYNWTLYWKVGEKLVAAGEAHRKN